MHQVEETLLEVDVCHASVQLVFSLNYSLLIQEDGIHWSRAVKD